MMSAVQNQEQMTNPEPSQAIKQEAVVPNPINAASKPPFAQRFVPINLPQNAPIFMAHNQQFMPTQIISGTNMKHQFVPIAPISNPTLPSSNNVPPSALLALQTQLMNARKDMKSANAEPPKPIMPQQQQQQQTMTYYNAANPIYLPRQSNNLKDEILNENWSAKIAYAATLSSVKSLYTTRAQLTLIHINGSAISSNSSLKSFFSLCL